MNATLSPSWELSTDHAASSHGQPVRVNRDTGEAFRPGDKVKLSPSQGDGKAVHAVAGLAETAKLNVDGDALVARFVGSLARRYDAGGPEGDGGGVGDVKGSGESEQE